jgi:hypothetical protein
MSPPSSESKNKYSRNEREGGSSAELATCFALVSWLTYFSTLRMEATCSSETSVDFQRTTRRYIPEDRTLHNHLYENLKSYLLNIFNSIIFLERGTAFLRTCLAIFVLYLKCFQSVMQCGEYVESRGSVLFLVHPFRVTSNPAYPECYETLVSD